MHTTFRTRAGAPLTYANPSRGDAMKELTNSLSSRIVAFLQPMRETSSVSLLRGEAIHLG
jgi:hypothetical protein